MRVLATYVLLAIVSAPALAQWYASYEKGMDAVRTQQWESVIRFMTDAINEKDEEKANAKTYGLRFIDYFPYVYRGAAYYELGQYQKSIDDLQRSQQIGEVRDAAKDEEAELLLGRYLQLANAKLGPNARLEEEFKTAVAIYDQGDYARAKTAFERILASSSGHAEAKRYLGLTNEKMQNLATANAEQTKKARLTSEFEEGIRLFNSMDYVAAERKFSDVLALDGTHTGANDYMKKVRSERKRADDIKTEFTQGVALFNRGSYQEARRRFSSVLQKESGHSGAVAYIQRIEQGEETLRLMSEGEQFLRAKQYDLAEEKFLAVLSRDKNNGKARGHLDTIKKSRSTTQIAERIRTLVSEGMAFLRRGDLGKAREKFQGVRLLDPNHAEAGKYLSSIENVEKMVILGIRAYLRGEYQESIKHLSEVSKGETPTPMSLAYLACSYAAEYFLDGTEDSSLQDDAVATYKRLKDMNEKYTFDTKVVSPRIVSFLTNTN